MLKRTYRRGPDKQIGNRVPTKKKKKRDCMMCYTPFLSEGIHNRICTKCKETEYYQTGQDYSMVN
jgi:hypothetical protein|tara:strand:- start:1479 stop:1673 length:195 start_codon:yes stop_codon:yes gene_type:complete